MDPYGHTTSANIVGSQADSSTGVMLSGEAPCSTPEQVEGHNTEPSAGEHNNPL